MKIGHVTGKVQRRDLAIAVPGLAETAGHAGHDETGAIDALLQPNEVATAQDRHHLTRQRQHRVAFGRAKTRSQAQPIEPKVNGFARVRHARSTFGGASLSSFCVAWTSHWPTTSPRPKGSTPVTFANANNYINLEQVVEI